MSSFSLGDELQKLEEDGKISLKPVKETIADFKEVKRINQFIEKKDRSKPMFNEACLAGDFKEVFITEGEMDARSLLQQGFKNVVGTTAGSGKFLPEWHEKLDNIEQIYLCFDSNEARQKGAYAVADKLGFERCKNILLPEGQDLNDYLKDHSRDDFLKLALKAKKFSIPSISSMPDVFKAFDEKLNSPQTDGIKTPWGNVNHRIGSFEPGDLIDLTGLPKIGKTTFALQIAYWNAMQNIASLFFCLEMRPERLLMKLAALTLDRKITTFDAATMGAVRGEIGHMPLYFGYTYKNIQRESVLETIRNAVKRYDINFVVFDNLHFLVRDIKHVTQEVALVSQSFKLLAEELKIPIMLIVHPRKVAPDTMITMNDLKDSASLGADADQIIILHRKPLKSDKGDGLARGELETTLEPETLVRIEASRYHPGGDTMLYFEGAKSKFRRLE